MTAPQHLIAARRTQAALTHGRALKALRDMVRARHPITFAAVAARAGVSRGYLYRTPDLAAKIREARQQPRLAPAEGTAGQQPVAALREHVRRLELHHAKELGILRAENDRLRRQLEVALGHLLTHDPSPNRITPPTVGSST